MPLDGRKANQTTLCFERYTPRGSSLATSQSQTDQQMNQLTTCYLVKQHILTSNSVGILQSINTVTIHP